MMAIADRGEVTGQPALEEQQLLVDLRQQAAAHQQFAQVCGRPPGLQLVEGVVCQRDRAIGEAAEEARDVGVVEPGHAGERVLHRGQRVEQRRQFGPDLPGSVVEQTSGPVDEEQWLQSLPRCSLPSVPQRTQSTDSRKPAHPVQIGVRSQPGKDAVLAAARAAAPDPQSAIAAGAAARAVRPVGRDLGVPAAANAVALLRTRTPGPARTITKQPDTTIMLSNCRLKAVSDRRDADEGAGGGGHEARKSAGVERWTIG